MKKRHLYLVVFCIASFVAGVALQRYGYLKAIKDYFSSDEERQLLRLPDTQHLTITYDDTTRLELERQIQLYHEHGVAYRVHPENKKYVKARVNEEECQLKVKGGHGHFKDSLKRSLSFKLKQGNKLRRFSIQAPTARNYLADWLFYELCKKEGLIVPKVQLVSVGVNGILKGLYQKESGMSYDLLALNQRSGGLLFRYDVSMLWKARKELVLTSIYEDLWHTSKLKSYKRLISGKDYELDSLLNRCASRIEKVKAGEVNISDVFNLDRYARLFAVTDFFGSRPHATYLTNSKFYYNPETELIEPVCYDQGALEKISVGLVGFSRLQGTIKNAITDYESFNDFLFSDSLFYATYINHLERLASTDFEELFLNDRRLQQASSTLEEEYPTYRLEDQVAILVKNRDIITNIISYDKMLIAKVLKEENDSVYIRIENMNQFPVVISKIHRKGKTKNLLSQSYWIQATSGKQRTITGNEVIIKVPAKTDEKLSVIYCFPGSTVLKTQKVKSL